MTTDALALANLVLTAALTGLIWTIQLVHYPLFARVGPEHWPAYEREHQTRITWIAAPLMLAAVGVAGVLVVAAPSAPSVANAVLAGAIFVATGTVYGPLHGRLAARFDEQGIARLVHLNWLRTVAWTVQLGVAIAVVATTG